VKFYLLVLIIGWRSDDRGSCSKLVFLCWWPLVCSLEWWSCFLVRDVWFLSRLSLKETDLIQNFDHNRRPVVPRVFTPTHLIQAQVRIKSQADKTRSDVSFAVGDKVFF
jgi:hypothetical protein